MPTMQLQVLRPTVPLLPHPTPALCLPRCSAETAHFATEGKQRRQAPQVTADEPGGLEAKPAQDLLATEEAEATEAARKLVAELVADPEVIAAAKDLDELVGLP